MAQQKNLDITRWTCWCVLDHCPAAEPKFGRRAQRQLIQEVTKDPTTISKELQASLASVKRFTSRLVISMVETYQIPKLILNKKT
ncbi:hypothetical protein QTP70_012636 [Hemibagrus guttatus]|uniref:Uncharacterized protein n=1 Tax=Hemibagrus guttatus TaxID=175788 RepID=A0AAE0RBX9_9TELE|nr:hypothetical protein QTP70_012636 [Hemibagrus guttatus]